MKTKQQDKIKYLALGMAVAVLVFAAVMLLCGIRYETNDDATLANIAAGAYGDSLHMVYVNVLFSVLLRPLYALAPRTNWYVIVQLVLMVAALGCLLGIIIKNSGIVNGLILSVAVAVPFAVTLFYSFQYVKSCAVMMAAGLVMIADDLGNARAQTIRGIAFVWLGSLIRWQNFYAVGAMSACMLLYRFFMLDTEHKKRAVATMVAMFCLVFGSKVVDNAAYSKGEWAEYKAYNEARMELSDYKIYFIDRTKENPLADAGVSDTEFKMIDGWDYWDTDLIPTERIQQIADSIPTHSIGWGVKAAVKTVLALTHGQSWRYVFWLVVAMGLLLVVPSAEWLAFAGTLAMGGALLFYLRWRERFVVRVEVTLLFSAVAMGLWLITKARKRTTKPVRIYAVVMAVACLLSVNGVKHGIAEGRARREIMAANEEEWCIQQLTYDTAHLYLISVSSIQTVDGEDVWHPRGKDFFHNIVAYGGWLTNSPTRRRVLRQYGVEDIFTDTVDNPAVCFDYHNIHRTARYISAHTGKNVAVISPSYNDVAPYQLVTE